MSDTLLLIHSDTTDGSTTFVDSSTLARAITVYGNTHHENTRAKFGATSIQFDGTGDYLTVPSAADLNIGTGDFTADLWLWVSSIADYDLVFGRLDSWGHSGQLFLRLHPGVAGLEVQIGSDYLQIPNLPLSAWNHISLVRLSSATTLRLNGVSTWSITCTANITATTPLYIGINPVNSAEALNGYIDEFRLTNAAEWTANFTPPTAPYQLGHSITAASPLQSPALLGELTILGYVSASSPLGAPELLLLEDFTDLLEGSVTRWAMDLITTTGTVRVPISSWQATLRAGSASYVQCVIPACLAWVEAINDATEFVIYRRAYVPGTTDVIEYEMARSVPEQAQFDQGPSRYTCTLSGYPDGVAEVVSPPAVYDRTLTGVRSISSGSGMRVRCAVDWLLRPGHRAYVGATPFVVGYINYYALENDSYMDAGE